MYFHLLFFCLHFYFGISARISSQFPHAEKRMIHPLGTLEHPKKQLDSTSHWSQSRSSNSNVNKVQRPMLVVRAGAGGAAVVDKQFSKKISKATARWEKSVNGKAMIALFHHLMTLPTVEVTQCVFVMAGNIHRDIFTDQFAALESLLRIINQKFSFDRSKIYISDYYFHESDKGVLQRRGYTILENSDTRKTRFISSTTFVFNTISSPQGVSHTLGRPGTHPSIYLGISPRYVIADTIRRPEVYDATFTMVPGTTKSLRESILIPFVRGRPFHELVADPGYKELRPPFAAYWNIENTSPSAPVTVAKAAIAGNEAESSKKPVSDMQGHGKDEGSSAGPSSQAPPSKADELS